MEMIILTIAGTVLCILVYAAIKIIRVSRREFLIDSYVFPESITQKIMEKYPHLTEAQANRVLDGLRDYFHVCNVAGRRMVAMPSQAVDVAWHEFILFTKKYDQFCNKALGRFLHHTPAEAMNSPTSAQRGIKRAWSISCKRENIQPRAAYKLPALFALDAQLKIPDGFKYSLNCKSRKTDNYCATHIGCSSASGFGCFGSGDSSSDGGSNGCGGGGCGGS